MDRQRKLEILDAYLKRNNLVRTEGEAWDAIMPFLILDIIYDVFKKTISPLPLKFEMNRWRKNWSRNYDKINQSFFRSFDEDQRDDVIDMMDQFGTWIKNDVDRLKFSFTGSLPIEDIETKKIIADCLVVSTLCKCAKYIFNRIFSKVRLRYGNPVEYVSQIERSALKISAFYYMSSTDFNANADPNLCNNVDVLCKRIILFLKQ